jgi:hypothetical protein
VPFDDSEFSAPAGDETGGADLNRLLAVLDRQDQVIMTLTYAYGLSNTEVAEVLEMPAGTVKARIHRAKARIRDLIDSPGSTSGAAPTEASERTSDRHRPRDQRPRSRAAMKPLQPTPRSAPVGSLTC